MSSKNKTFVLISTTFHHALYIFLASLALEYIKKKLPRGVGTYLGCVKPSLRARATSCVILTEGDRVNKK